MCRDGGFSEEVECSGDTHVTCSIQHREIILQRQDSGTISPHGSSFPPTPEPSPSTALRRSNDVSPRTAGAFGHSFFELMSTMTRSVAGLEHDPPVFNATYRGSNIISMVYSGAADGKHRVFLEASSPPIFDFVPLDLITGDPHDGPPHRLASMGPHNEPMPSGSLYMVCLSFANDKDAATFLKRCKSLHLPRARERYISVSKRRLYRQDNMALIGRLMEQMPFELAFEIEKALAHGVLDPMEIISLTDMLLKPGAAHYPMTAGAFRLFASQLETPSLRLSNPGGTLQSSRSGNSEDLSKRLKKAAETAYERSLERMDSLISSTPGRYHSYQVIITPAAMRLEGPLPDQSNNMLRRFGHHDCFIRLTFQDEEQSKIRRVFRGDLWDIRRVLDGRFLPCLTKGIRIAGRSFKFLAYSMSGLKQATVWLVTPFEWEGKVLNARAILKRLGDFTPLEYKPARLGARRAQAFSGSDPTVILKSDEVVEIDDRIHPVTRSTFTDGCGTISPELATIVWRKLQRSRGPFSTHKYVPSCMQIRLGGTKGVVVVDSRLTGKKICIRPSQKKFEAPGDRALNIIATSWRPSPLYLNKPLIAVLEHQGTNAAYISELQLKAIEEAEAVCTSFLKASKSFDRHGFGGSFRLPALFRDIVDQLHVEVSLDALSKEHHGFLATILLHARNTILRELKYRARILVPGSYTLLGVSDECDCLEEGEVYVNIYNEQSGHSQAVEGDVLVTRSPQMHPGDVRMVKAVRRRELSNLRNVVVFSCRGSRSLPSCLSGGDLDGDVYNVILDPKLFIKGPNAIPASYEQLPDKQLSRRCTSEDLAQFVVDYISSDIMGLVANRLMRVADSKGFDCDDARVLAQLNSQAVDFPKTGTPVSSLRLPRVSQIKPDFLAFEWQDPSNPKEFYESRKILGRLFRSVTTATIEESRDTAEQSRKDRAHIESALRALDVGVLGLPPLGAVAGDDLKSEMDELLKVYSNHLRLISRTHALSKHASAGLSEAELASGTIQRLWPDHEKRTAAVAKMNLELDELCNAVRRRLQGVVDDEHDSQHDGSDIDESNSKDQAQQKGKTFVRAWAAWRVADEALSADPSSFGPQSFGLIALGVLLEIIRTTKEKARRRV